MVLISIFSKCPPNINNGRENFFESFGKVRRAYSAMNENRWKVTGNLQEPAATVPRWVSVGNTSPQPMSRKLTLRIPTHKKARFTNQNA